MKYQVTLTLKSGYSKTVTVKAATSDEASLKARRSSAVSSTRINPIVSVVVTEVA